MLEKKVFDELNVFDADGGPSDDLIEDLIPLPPVQPLWKQVLSPCCSKKVKNVASTLPIDFLQVVAYILSFIRLLTFILHYSYHRLVWNVEI